MQIEHVYWTDWRSFVRREKIDRLNIRFNGNRYYQSGYLCSFPLACVGFNFYCRAINAETNPDSRRFLLFFDSKYTEDFVVNHYKLRMRIFPLRFRSIKLCLRNENTISLFLSVASLSSANVCYFIVHRSFVHRLMVDMEIANRWNAKISCALVATDCVFALVISNSPLEIGT